MAIYYLQVQRIAQVLAKLVFNKRGDDYGEKAVILVLVVLGGVAAFAAFGGKIVEMITAATGGM